MTSVDKRVVEMGFENKQFENNIQTSLKSLNELKKGLDLDASAKSLTHLSDAGKSFSLQGISDGVNHISNSFSALGVVGFTVIHNLTNAAINFGKKVFDSLLTKPLKMGLQEYETQIDAIQTVLANTASKGTTLQDVNSALDELNEYADKTIYNFTQMTKNIGTFTAAGITLETSVSAIKGIANLAAVSGSNAQQASTAMYQLSQALASGTVKLMDWNSVVNAGMGGQVFQDALKETARIHGIKIDDMIKKEGSFRETLQRGWLTSEILTETLSKFTGDLTEEQLKTMGYTEEQIAGIIKLGEMANDAATKVKTFSQLKDTAMEALQSGWGQTWRLLIGDFEEARTLWTDVSDALGGYISASSETRNEMLQLWKFMGGRTLAIEAIKNAFSALIAVVTPIKEAFTEIFPPITGKTLIKLTKTVHKFSEKLKLSKSAAEKIKRTFKGVASIFMIVFQAVDALAEGFANVAKKINLPKVDILEFTAGIGDFLVGVNEGIKVNDTFGKALEKVGEYASIGIAAVKNFGLAIGEYVSTFRKKLADNTLLQEYANKVRVFVSNLFDSIKLIKNIDTSGITSFLSKIKERFAPLGKIGDFLGDAFGSIFDGIFNRLSTSVKDGKKTSESVLKIFGKILAGIGDALKKIDFSKVNFDPVFDGINSALLTGLTLAIVKFVNKGGSIFDGISGIFDSFKGVVDSVKDTGSKFNEILDGVRGTLEAYQQSIRADILLKIAGAIAVLTLSLLVLSLIDSAKLTTALTALTVVFADLFGAMALYEKTSGAGGVLKMGKVALGMLALATATLLLAGAVALLAKLNQEELIQGMAAITGITILLVASSEILSRHSGNMLKAGLGLIFMAAALNLMVIAVSGLSKLDVDQLLRGLGGMAVLLLELVLFTKLIEGAKMNVGTGLALIGLAVTVAILAKSLELFSNMKPEAATQGLKVMGLLLAEIALFVKLVGDTKMLISTAVSMVILGGAMLIFAEAISRMGEMKWEEIARGLSAMAGALAIVIATMRLMPKNMLSTAVSLLIVGAALVVISQALSSFGSMSWEEIGKGLGVLAGAMLILAVGLNAMNGALVGAAAMLIVAAALTMIVPLFKTLGSMSLAEIGIGLLAIAGVFAVFGLAGLLLAPVVPVLIALGVAMTLFGVACLAAGTGLLLFSMGLAAIAVSGAAGAVAFSLIVTTLIGLIPLLIQALVGAITLFAVLIAESAGTIGKALGQTLLSLLGVILDVAPQLLEGLITLLRLLINAIVTIVPEFIDAVLYLLTTLLQSLADSLPDIIQAGMDMILALLEGIRDNIFEIVTVAIDIVTEFIDAVAEKIPDVIDSGFNLIIEFINGLATSIEENAPELNEAVGNLAKAIVDGLCDGLTNGVTGVVSAIGKLAGAAIDALKTLLGIFSPSKVFRRLGEFTTKGFVVGLLSLAKRVGDASANLGDRAINGITSAVSQISDAVNGNIDMSPTIRPVVDLTDVISSGKKIDGFFGENRLATLETSNSLARMANSVRSANNPETQTISSNQTISFTQNNYSPTALSRLDIYRQTKNQLIALKGLVPNT